jgi:hypothetical protein
MLTTHDAVNDTAVCRSAVALMYHLTAQTIGKAVAVAYYTNCDSVTLEVLSPLCAVTNHALL